MATPEPTPAPNAALPKWTVSMPAPNAAGHPSLTVEAADEKAAVAAYLAKLKLSDGARPVASCGELPLTLASAKPSTPETK
jgi:hypothetical protein